MAFLMGEAAKEGGPGPGERTLAQVITFSGWDVGGGEGDVVSLSQTTWFTCSSATHVICDLASYLTFSNLSFPICTMGLITTSLLQGCWDDQTR